MTTSFDIENIDWSSPNLFENKNHSHLFKILPPNIMQLKFLNIDWLIYLFIYQDRRRADPLKDEVMI